MRSVLVIVHPDSACGSADFNLGISQASEARSRLVGEISSWSNGPVVVLRGMFSSELGDYPAVRDAVSGALLLSSARGEEAITVRAPDPDQEERIAEIVDRSGWEPDDTSFRVTGCWASHSTEGCVNSVAMVLRVLGYRVEISRSAIYEPGLRPRKP